MHDAIRSTADETSADLPHRDDALSEFGFDLDPDDWLERVRRSVDASDPAGAIVPDILVSDFERAGERVGPYELEGQIGAGGMGTVWRAHRVDSHFRRTVAIKMIKRGMDTADILHRFRMERQVLAELEHPNIATLYDGGATADGRPYLVMELVEGSRINQHCEQAHLDIDQILELFRRVCMVVHFAHTSLVLHRDLKPSNILVTRDGEPKLLDFGIAKVLSADGAAVTAVTATEQRALTPQYASPEQILGDRVGTASDTYALGVILYELLTRRSPYSADASSRSSIERAVVKDRPAPPSASVLQRDDLPSGERRRLAKRLRGDLDTIVMKALEKAPDDRYQSAQQLADDVQRHLDGLPLLARRAGALRLISRVARRHRATIIAGAVAATLALILTASAVTYSFMAPRWANDHIRAAHSTLLHRDAFNRIWIDAYFNAPAGEQPGATEDLLNAALAHYEPALRFDPQAERASDERHVVHLALMITRRYGSAPPLPQSFCDVAPLTCTYASEWSTKKALPALSEEQLTRASQRDLRSLGLLTALCHKYVAALDVWSKLDEIDSDPLVEALFGVLYLAVEKPELAYPRLLSAYRSYPENGYLCTMLADAAVRCGDLPMAERLLAGADELPNQDHLQGLRRVRMQYLLAVGKEDDAATLYWDTELHTSAVAAVTYAEHLFDRGKRRQALGVLVDRCDVDVDALPYRVPRRTIYAMLTLTNRWWREIEPTRRVRLVESVGRESADDLQSLPRIARAYQRCVHRLERFHTESVMRSDNLPHGPTYDSRELVDDEFLAISQRLVAENRDE